MYKKALIIKFIKRNWPILFIALIFIMLVTFIQLEKSKITDNQKNKRNLSQVERLLKDEDYGDYRAQLIKKRDELKKKIKEYELKELLSD